MTDKKITNTAEKHVHVHTETSEVTNTVPYTDIRIQPWRFRKRLDFSYQQTD